MACVWSATVDTQVRRCRYRTAPASQPLTITKLATPSPAPADMNVTNVRRALDLLAPLPAGKAHIE